MNRINKSVSIGGLPPSRHAAIVTRAQSNSILSLLSSLHVHCTCLCQTSFPARHRCQSHSAEKKRHPLGTKTVVWPKSSLFATSRFPVMHLICLPPPPPPTKKNLPQPLFFISPGYYSLPKRNWKQCLCKIFGDGGGRGNKLHYGRCASGVCDVIAGRESLMEYAQLWGLEE